MTEYQVLHIGMIRPPLDIFFYAFGGECACIIRHKAEPQVMPCSTSTTEVSPSCLPFPVMMNVPRSSLKLLMASSTLSLYASGASGLRMLPDNGRSVGHNRRLPPAGGDKTWHINERLQTFLSEMLLPSESAERPSVVAGCFYTVRWPGVCSHPVRYRRRCSNFCSRTFVPYYKVVSFF